MYLNIWKSTKQPLVNMIISSGNCKTIKKNPFSVSIFMLKTETRAFKISRVERVQVAMT